MFSSSGIGSGEKSLVYGYSPLWLSVWDYCSGKYKRLTTIISTRVLLVKRKQNANS